MTIGSHNLSSDQIRLALSGSNSIANGSVVTISLQFMLTATPAAVGYGLSIADSTSATDYLGIRFTTGRELTVRYEKTAGSPGGVTVATGEALTVNRWYDLAIVFDSSGSPDLRFYIDGVEVASATPYTLDWSLLTGANGVVSVGGRELNAGPGNYVDCRVGRVTIWRTELSPTELMSIATGTDPATIQPESVHTHADLTTSEDATAWAGGSGNGSGKSGLTTIAGGTTSLVGTLSFTDYICHPHIHATSGDRTAGDTFDWKEEVDTVTNKGGGMKFSVDAACWVAPDFVAFTGNYTGALAVFYGPSGQRLVSSYPTNSGSVGTAGLENTVGDDGEVINRFDFTGPFVELDEAGEWAMNIALTGSGGALKAVDVFRGNAGKVPADFRPATFGALIQVVFNGETITAYSDGRNGEHYLYNETTGVTTKMSVTHSGDIGDKNHSRMSLAVVRGVTGGDRIVALIVSHSNTNAYLMSATTVAGLAAASAFNIGTASDGISGAADSISYGHLLESPNEDGVLWIYPRSNAEGTRVWKVTGLHTTPTVEGWVLTSSNASPAVRHYTISAKILTGTTNASGYVLAFGWSHRIGNVWGGGGAFFFDPDAEQCYDCNGVLLGGGSATGKIISTDPLITDTQRDTVLGDAGGGILFEAAVTGSNIAMFTACDMRLQATGLTPANSKLQCCAIITNSACTHLQYATSYTRLIIVDGDTIVASGLTDDTFGIGAQNNYRIDALCRWDGDNVQAVLFPRNGRKVPNQAAEPVDATDYMPLYHDFGGAEMVKTFTLNALAATNASELEAATTIVSRASAQSLGAATVRHDGIAAIEGTDQPAQTIGAPVPTSNVDAGSATFVYYVSTGGGRLRQIVDIKTANFESLSSGSGGGAGSMVGSRSVPRVALRVGRRV